MTNIKEILLQWFINFWKKTAGSNAYESTIKSKNMLFNSWVRNCTSQLLENLKERKVCSFFEHKI